MAKITDREELRNWLDDQSRKVAVCIAARAALRVLPVLRQEFESSLPEEEISAALILPVFRAMAVSWVAASHPTHDTELIDAATASASFSADAAAAASAASFSAVSAAASASFSAAAAASASFSAASAASFSAVSAAASASFSAAASASFSAAASASAASTIWTAISWDTTEIEKGTAAEAVAARKLWPRNPPKALAEPWRDLKKKLEEMPDDWRVWTDWYQARLDGKPTYPDLDEAGNEALEVARVTLPAELWDEGPAAVNREIAGLAIDGGGTCEADNARPWRTDEFGRYRERRWSDTPQCIYHGHTAI